jgi:hypothetical protein
MVKQEEIDKQLKDIDFNVRGWGRAEIKELPNVILPDEEIYECVNGFYEGGFALLLATNIRVLLVDKKPLNYLTVEDMRFDNISEIDYNHRLVGANVTVSAGDKHLRFTSYNQKRLRKLIGHTQHCMAKLKQDASEHQMDQRGHLEQINKQLQAYLVQQHKQQQKLYEEMQGMRSSDKKRAEDDASAKLADAQLEALKPVEPSPELKDFLYAQGLLAQYVEQRGAAAALPVPPAAAPTVVEQPNSKPEPKPKPLTVQADPAANQLAELYAAGMQEIFGGKKQSSASAQPAQPARQTDTSSGSSKSLEINPLKVAYSKLPQALRSKKFGLPFQGGPAKTGSKPEPA